MWFMVLLVVVFVLTYNPSTGMLNSLISPEPPTAPVAQVDPSLTYYQSRTFGSENPRLIQENEIGAIY